MPEGASPAVPGSDEVRRMMPGPEMDRLVAELVLGWVDVRSEFVRGALSHPGADFLFGRPPAGNRGIVPDYSADIAAAWEVVLKFGPGVRLTWHALCPETGQSFVWAAALWAGGAEVVGYGSTAPIALCRAALLAAGAAGPT